MSLDEEEQRTLDLCAEKLRDLLEAELNREVGEEPTANPQLYLENLLRRFSPWEKPEILAKKRYWISKGGVKAMMDYLQAPNLHTRLMAAHACWNFAESLEFEKVQYELGALEQITKLIQTRGVDEYYRKALVEAGFGWLWGFLEYEETLEYVNEQNIVPVLVECVGDDNMSMSVVIGCIQSCAVHAGCRKSIVEANGIATLVGVATGTDITQDTLNSLHHSVITLAHLLNDDRFRQLCIGAGAAEKIRNFLETKTAEEISQIEDEQAFLWQMMAPFYNLCESAYQEVYEVGAFCQAYLSLRQCNADRMIAQEIPPKLLCLSWMRNRSALFKSLIAKASSVFLKKTSVPSLKQMCYFKLMDTLGPKDLALKLAELHMCSTIDPKGQTGIVGLSIEVKIQMDERLAILTDECDPLRETTLYNLAQDFSASWLSSESMPRKRYWQQIGGVEAMMKYLTDEDQRMRLLAVYACWNFAENLEFLRCEYNLGALPHIIRFVKSEDPDEKNAGVGWLWSFLEQVELLPAMEQEGVIGILVNSIRDTRFHLQLLVGCLQSCSICPSCRKTMVDLNVIEKLTAVIKQNKELSAHYTGAHKAIHHAAITLAHLLNDDRFTERTKGVQVDETLRYFMASFTPKEIFELEKQLGYSWQNLQPFYTLCESSVPEVYQMGAFCMEFLSWDGTSGQKMVDQDIVQKLVCLSWMKNRGTKFIENINQALNNLKLYYLAPSLKQICYFKLLENHGKNLRAMLEAYHLL